MNKCWDCKFYRGDQYVGRCHRFPPTGGGFAEVRPDDWCGEFVQMGAGPERRLDALGARLVDRVSGLTYKRADV